MIPTRVRNTAIFEATRVIREETPAHLSMVNRMFRGDVETIKSHLEATDRNSPETGRAYAALALASLHIARDQGGLSDEDFELIKRLLSPANQK